MPAPAKTYRFDMRDDASIVPYKLFLCTINLTDKIDLAEV